MDRELVTCDCGHDTWYVIVNPYSVDIIMCATCRSIRTDVKMGDRGNTPNAAEKPEAI